MFRFFFKILKESALLSLTQEIRRSVLHSSDSAAVFRRDGPFFRRCFADGGSRDDRFFRESVVASSV